MEKENQDTTKSIFIRSYEREEGSLGRKWIKSFLTEGSISKSVVLVSNKRVYQKGKMLEKKGLGQPTLWDGSRIIQLSHVSGSSFLLRRFIGSAIIGCIAIMVALSFFFYASQHRRADEFYIFGFTLMVLGVLFLIIYFFKRDQLFIIHFHGGEIILNTSWYSKKELEKFQKDLHSAIDSEKNIESENLKPRISKSSRQEKPPKKLGDSDK